MIAKLTLRFLALGYLALLLVLPVSMVFVRTLSNGLGRCGTPSRSRRRFTPCG